MGKEINLKIAEFKPESHVIDGVLGAICVTTSNENIYIPYTQMIALAENLKIQDNDDDDRK